MTTKNLCDKAPWSRPITDPSFFLKGQTGMDGKKQHRTWGNAKPVAGVLQRLGKTRCH
jgi:hypothetical protein